MPRTTPPRRTTGDKPAPARKAASKKAARPGTPTISRKEQAMRTRARLADALKAALDRTSYRHLRVADVTAEAHVAVGLFYHYFPDMKTITIEVLSEFMTELTEQARSVPHDGDLFNMLREQYRILIGHCARHPGLIRCMLQASDETPEFGDIWKSFNSRWTRSFARYLTGLWGQEALDERSALLLAYSLGALTDGILQEYFVQKNPDLIGCARSTDELAEVLAMLTYRAIFLTAPDPGKRKHADALMRIGAPPTQPARRQ